MVIKRSPGGEFGGGGRSTWKSTCEVPGWLHLAIDQHPVCPNLAPAWTLTSVWSYQLTSDLRDVYFLEMHTCLAMVVSESSFGVYVCLRRPAGLHRNQRSCFFCAVLFCDAYSSLPGNNYCPLPGDVYGSLPRYICQYPAWAGLQSLPGTLASSLPGNGLPVCVPCLGMLAVPAWACLQSLPGHACSPCLGMLAVPAWDACHGRCPLLSSFLMLTGQAWEESRVCASLICFCNEC